VNCVPIREAVFIGVDEIWRHFQVVLGAVVIRVEDGLAAELELLVLALELVAAVVLQLAGEDRPAHVEVELVLIAFGGVVDHDGAARFEVGARILCRVVGEAVAAELRLRGGQTVSPVVAHGDGVAGAADGHERDRTNS